MKHMEPNLITIKTLSERIDVLQAVLVVAERVEKQYICLDITLTSVTLISGKLIHAISTVFSIFHTL